MLGDLGERYIDRWEDERYNCGSGKDMRVDSYSYALDARLGGRAGTSRPIRGPGWDELRMAGDEGVWGVYTGWRRSAQRLIGESGGSCADGEGLEGGAAPGGMVTYGRGRWAMDQPQTRKATRDSGLGKREVSRAPAASGP